MNYPYGARTSATNSLKSREQGSSKAREKNKDVKAALALPSPKIKNKKPSPSVDKCAGCEFNHGGEMCGRDDAPCPRPSPQSTEGNDDE